jgi:predicted DNA-binding protein
MYRKEDTMPTAVKSYSLDLSVIDRIATLARDLNKKQSQIIKDAIEAYDDLLDAVENKSIADACDRGEMRVWSFDEIKAQLDAKLKAADNG